MANNLISNLSIGNAIGSGYFATVYEGSDPVHGQVAVKIFQKDPNQSDYDWALRKENLLREGQRLKDAEHNNIVQVFHILESENDDEIFLVMEHCENGCLQDHFDANPMQLGQLRSYLTDAAFGLQAIHARGMLHRDIKPSNILIDQKNRAKLADFGLVTNDIIMGYASLKGYVDHLAKEVFDNGFTSIRSDIWAFGMTTYRLLHGSSFYQTIPDPRTAIPKGGFATKLPWLPHIPDRWRRFVRRAMNDDPNLRFQNAEELLQNLGQLPVNPDWICEDSINQTRWYRIKNDRNIEVLWTRHSQRKHEWDARSRPLDREQGRSRRLNGSNGLINRGQAITELKEFFANSN